MVHFWIVTGIMFFICLFFAAKDESLGYKVFCVIKWLNTTQYEPVQSKMLPGWEIGREWLC